MKYDIFNRICVPTLLKFVTPVTKRRLGGAKLKLPWAQFSILLAAVYEHIGLRMEIQHMNLKKACVTKVYLKTEF